MLSTQITWNRKYTYNIKGFENLTCKKQPCGYFRHDQGFEFETTEKHIHLLVKVEREPKTLRLRVHPLDNVASLEPTKWK